MQEVQSEEAVKKKHAGGRPKGIIDTKTPLKRKDKKVLDGLCEGKTMKQSMIDAGYSITYSTTQSSVKMKALAPKIKEIMDRADLTDNKLVERLKEGIYAKKISYFQKGGIVTDQREDEDLVTSHKYLETGLKLRGHLREKLDVNVNVDLADRLHKARMNARVEAGLMPETIEIEATG